MIWAFVFLFVVLKIPVIAAIWLCWWAGRDAPVDEGPGDDGGSPPHPRSPLPRLPRRGPHGDPPLPAPARIRGVAPSLERARE
ncbi:MAG: hypothetical protein IRZ21_02545 [Thermoleophilaceae bacterium]|nr:hypothetical protein [Thermoleophilaceae bacterium]